MPVTRFQLVEEARTWAGTPYRHQGRVKGVGVDCAGLIVCVMRALGLPAIDMEGYARRPDGTLLDHVRSQTDAVAPGEHEAGDIVVFHWDRQPVHLGMLTGAESVIHSYAINRKVVEHDMDDRLRRAVAAYRRIRGVV